MCGICGVWDPSGIDSELLARMNETLSHRGPDDEGLENLGEVGLAVRRLSIIDVAGGHQPIHNEEKTTWIAFNGEIYNYRELRRDLERRGHRFRTCTDTEVVLHLHEELEEDVVSELRGMFAFAIWDSRRRRLLLVRDRFGQKPLYYSWDGRRFLFASEIKAVLAALPRTPDLRIESLDDYLTLRFIPSPYTMFEGILKLPAGHLLVLDAKERKPTGVSGTGRMPLEIRPYWKLSYLPKRELSEREAVDEVSDLVREAVKCHLVSDVPVGAFLSGGMDSSLIVAMISEIVDEPVQTFSIGVEEQEFNELGFAGEVARHCGTDHREEVVWPDLVKLLPRMVYYLEEPSDPIAACMYHAAALATRHVKVVLTGDGGDEMFAGFDRYYGYRWIRYYAALPEAVRRFVFGPLFRTLPDTAGYKTFAQKARWLHDLSGFEGGRRYAQATVFFRFGDLDKQGLYGPAVSERLAGRDSTECIVSSFEAAAADTDLDRMLYADAATRLAEHSLMLTDRMTMMHSLEGRSPFLDHRLAEAVATLPANLKVKGGRLKYLLRKIAEPYLPERILRRQKQGFMFPVGYWMKGPLLPVIEDLAERSVLVQAEIFNGDTIRRMISEHLSDRTDHHVRLWMLLNAELWHRMYLEGGSVDDLQSMLEERVAPHARLD